MIYTKFGWKCFIFLFAGGKWIKCSHIGNGFYSKVSKSCQTFIVVTRRTWQEKNQIPKDVRHFTWIIWGTKVMILSYKIFVHVTLNHHHCSSIRYSYQFHRVLSANLKLNCYLLFWFLQMLCLLDFRHYPSNIDIGELINFTNLGMCVSLNNEKKIISIMFDFI